MHVGSILRTLQLAAQTDQDRSRDHEFFVEPSILAKYFPLNLGFFYFIVSCESDFFVAVSKCEAGLVFFFMSVL
jgi:hypothetical protein